MRTTDRRRHTVASQVEKVVAGMKKKRMESVILGNFCSAGDILKEHRMEVRTLIG